MDEVAQDTQAAIPDDAPQHLCKTCGGYFGAGDVWDAGGQIVCKSCYSKSASRTALTQAIRSATIPADGGAGSDRSHNPSQRRGTILAKVTCPHCWHRFAAEDILWVSQHAELMGDIVLGPDAASRFLPTRFTIGGDALDARGVNTQILACPHCHLVVPRAWIEVDPLFVSIVGVPSSGKSYFLTTMTWELRRLLPSQFAVTFSDADASTNRILNGYEELRVRSANPIFTRRI